jgi:hypothetical protein
MIAFRNFSTRPEWPRIQAYRTTRNAMRAGQVVSARLRYRFAIWLLLHIDRQLADMRPRGAVQRWLFAQLDRVYARIDNSRHE